MVSPSEYAVSDGARPQSSSQLQAVRFVLLLSRQGKVRLAKWYTTYTQKERAKVQWQCVFLAGTSAGSRGSKLTTAVGGPRCDPDGSCTSREAL